MSKKEFWDFDENINYKNVNIEGHNYKVLGKYSNYYTAALILNNISNIIRNICIYLKINYYRYSKNDQLLIDCFCLIHPDNYYLSEMQLDTIFDGINKPRDLYISKYPSIGKDKNLRASYRHIFLTLRDKYGNFKDKNYIIELVIHEITHTMCNHVTWRNDDHGKDFKHAEELIINAYKNTLMFPLLNS